MTRAWSVRSGQALGNRAVQEDSYAIVKASDDNAVAMVLCDGLAGHGNGDVASKTVCDAVAGYLKGVEDWRALLGTDTNAFLSQLVEIGTSSIRDAIAKDATLSEMATTLLVVILLDDMAHWVSVGDCGFYLFGRDEITRLNQDHSLRASLQKLLEQGLIAPQDIASHPAASTISSVISTYPPEEIEIQSAKINSDQSVFLASDGLEALSEGQILSCLRPNSPAALLSPETILIDPCWAKDNLTVISAS